MPLINEKKGKFIVKTLAEMKIVVPIQNKIKY